MGRRLDGAAEASWLGVEGRSERAIVREGGEGRVM